jgi:hypothetical protein
MASDNKLTLVREFLRGQLPDCMVSEKCDPDPETLAFVISAPSHSILFKIRKCVVQDKNSRQLVDMLDQMNIAYLFKQYPDVDALVISCARDHT